MIPSIPQGTEDSHCRAIWESLKESEKPEPALEDPAKIKHSIDPPYHVIGAARGEGNF
jgi:hypothetical protein